MFAGPTAAFVCIALCFTLANACLFWSASVVPTSGIAMSDCVYNNQSGNNISCIALYSSYVYI